MLQDVSAGYVGALPTAVELPPHSLVGAVSQVLFVGMLTLFAQIVRWARRVSIFFVRDGQPGARFFFKIIVRRARFSQYWVLGYAYNHCLRMYCRVLGGIIGRMVRCIVDAPRGIFNVDSQLVFAVGTESVHWHAVELHAVVRDDDHFVGLCGMDKKCACNSRYGLGVKDVCVRSVLSGDGAKYIAHRFEAFYTESCQLLADGDGPVCPELYFVRGGPEFSGDRYSRAEYFLGIDVKIHARRFKSIYT